ncbi:MAG: hypothetical protein ACRDT2_11085 [Natronosporangium sp.]
MAKESGLGARLFVAGLNYSGDVGQLQAIGGGMTVQDTTPIDKLAMARIGLLRDGRIEYTAFWNPDGVHPSLAALPTADQPVAYYHRAAIGAPAAAMVGKQIGYDPTRNQDGSLTAGIQALANGFGLEWGQALTAGAQQLTPGVPNGTGLDYGATVGTTLFGLQAYLHVLAFVGTGVALSIQHSDDDGAVDPYVDVPGAVFSQVTAAPGSQRLQTDRDQAVKRWLRVAAAGTFTSVDVAVVVVKNRAEVIF